MDARRDGVSCNSGSGTQNSRSVKARDLREISVKFVCFSAVYIATSSASLSGLIWFIESLVRVPHWVGVRDARIGSVVSLLGSEYIVSLRVRRMCLESAADRADCAGMG